MSERTLSILVVTGIYPPDVGGPATFVPRICRELVSRGHRVELISLSDQPSSDLDQDAPYSITRIRRGLPKTVRIVRTIREILIRGRHADVLFVNGLPLESTLANLVLRKPLLMKVVGDYAWERAVSHGWTHDEFEAFQHQQHGLRVSVLKQLRRWWTGRANRVVAPSEYLRKIIVGWGVDPGRCVAIRNAPIVPEELHSGLPLEPSDSQRLRLITVARLVSWKGVDGILRVLVGIPDVCLTIVGDGPLDVSLRALADELGLNDRVTFAGRRSPEDTLAFVRSSDVFVLNSTYEGLPHVILEALALGVPVIATAVGGTPEVVIDGENGLLVPPADDAALARAITQLLQPDLLKTLREGARLSGAKLRFDRLVGRYEEQIVALVDLTAGLASLKGDRR